MAKKKKKDASLGKHAAKSDSDKKSKGTDTGQSDQSSGASASGTDATKQMPVVDESATQAVKPIDPAQPSYADGQAADYPAFSQDEPKRKGKGLKIFGITLASILAALVIVYGAGCFLFMDRFYPNTIIGSHDVSMRTTSECAPEFNEAADDYVVDIQGRGLSLTLTALDINLKFDGLVIAQAAHDKVTPWMWPLEIFGDHDYSDSLLASYDKEVVSQEVSALIDEHNAAATPPTNASAVFDEKTQKFTISPEKIGTTLDKEVVLDKIDKAITTLTPEVKITADELEQATVLSTSKELEAACKQADTMITANISLVLNGAEIAALNPALQSTWISFGEDFSVTLNEEAFNAWTESLISNLNTVGTERTYTRPDGKVITVSGGTYGWEIDGDSLRTQIKEGMSAGLVGAIEIPVWQSGTGFAALGGQDWGARYCDIDLSEQYARFYDETGALVWESSIISGKPDGKHNTPTGAYMLNQKQSPSKLIGEIDPKTKKPEYETVVTYWMPFVGNAVGLHDATWQPSFGGSMYANGYGSHGCVNLPYSAAEALYGIIQPGDPVICHW